MKKNVGKCIYCGTCSEFLSDEHVIPEGLLIPKQEAVILKAASCQNCQKIINLVETDTLHNLLKLPRSFLGLRSKHKTHKSTHLTTADRKMIEIPISDLGAWIMLPVFEIPHFGKENYDGIKTKVAIFIKNGGLDYRKLMKEMEVKTLSVRFRFSPSKFARTLAKIAHGFAVYQYGLDRFQKAFLPETILGEEKSVGKWVGSIAKKHPKDKLYIRVKIGIVKGNQILCQISLFDEWGGPTYVICVGTIKSK